MKGLFVYVLRSHLGDCTNGGVTSKYNDFLLVGEGVDGPFDSADYDTDRILVLRHVTVGGYKSYYASPLALEGTGKHAINGGNFIHSYDARFKKLTIDGNPIRVHDRVEG